MLQLLQPLLQCPESAQQIAAVNSGDVTRFERHQRPDIVPVEEMPFIALQTTDGCHGAGQLFDNLVNRQVAAVMGAQGAGHPETDVGRAGSHGQTVLMGNLIIVRRQPRGFSIHKG